LWMNKNSLKCKKLLPNMLSKVVFGKLLFGVITFSSHQLQAIVNMPPRTDTSTKREYGTTIFIPLPPFPLVKFVKKLKYLTKNQNLHKISSKLNK
jgi:hypothetical protein